MFSCHPECDFGMFAVVHIQSMQKAALVHFQVGGGVVGVTNPTCLSPGFVLQKCKRDPDRQCPHPELKISNKSQQIPRHARVCPQGHPPGWPLISALKQEFSFADFL